MMFSSEECENLGWASSVDIGLGVGEFWRSPPSLVRYAAEPL